LRVIRPTYLVSEKPAAQGVTELGRKRPARQLVPEYFLLVLMIGLACLVNYLNWRADDQDKARIFAVHNTNARAPRPPYIISTPMRHEIVAIDGVKIRRQWYFNDDASMRYVDIVPPDGSKKVGYLKNDVVYSHDRTRKIWQKTEVPHGDFGPQAAFISFNFDYKNDTDYTVTVVSATQGGWEWTHHIDTYRAGQLTRQLIYSRSGAVTERQFAMTPPASARPVGPDPDSDDTEKPHAPSADNAPAKSGSVPARRDASATPCRYADVQGRERAVRK
jgi:hypothetical protein